MPSCGRKATLQEEATTPALGHTTLGKVVSGRDLITKTPRMSVGCGEDVSDIHL